MEKEIIKQKLSEYIDITFDNHIHIGQYYNTYYNPYKIIRTLKRNNIKGCYFSSTTSCIKWNNDDEKRYYINHIDEEIKEALCEAKELSFDARPLYWVNPERHWSGDKLFDEDTIYNLLNNSYYKGFKIHTKIDKWDINTWNYDCLFNTICIYANDNNMPIFIHCGVDLQENPIRFKNYYSKYKEVNFILCHMKPFDIVVELMRKYNNIFTDTAFVNIDDISKLIDRGFADRILFGTDYPINNYYTL